MVLLDEAEARLLWCEALQNEGWQDRKIRLVMFDWRPEMGKISYHPAPAWPTVANSENRADRARFLELVERILNQGKRYSSLGSAPRLSTRPEIEFAPRHVDQIAIRNTILKTLETIQPGAVNQQQILRCAMMAHLPPELLESLGTRFAAVHPELPTPSNNYKRTGNHGMCGRYDLGFGHPTQIEDIVGVIELETVKGSVTALLPDKADEESDEKDVETIELHALQGDFEKLLDPKLPASALRVSVLVAGARSRLSTDEIIASVRRIRSVNGTAFLTSATVQFDPETQWLRWSWTDSAASLHLAWYHPSLLECNRFESMWSALSGQ
jgi:hypothetical protein